MINPAKPRPKADGLSTAYWEGTTRGELVLQRCAACSRVRHYPQYLCSFCHSDSYEWTVSPGIGLVHSWTVTHHSFLPAFADEIPYALVTVDLEEGVRALGRWASSERKNLVIGQSVIASFHRREDGYGDLVWIAT